MNRVKLKYSFLVPTLSQDKGMFLVKKGDIFEVEKDTGNLLVLKVTEETKKQCDITDDDDYFIKVYKQDVIELEDINEGDDVKLVKDTEFNKGNVTKGKIGLVLWTEDEVIRVQFPSIKLTLSYDDVTKVDLEFEEGEKVLYRNSIIANILCINKGSLFHKDYGITYTKENGTIVNTFVNKGELSKLDEKETLEKHNTFRIGNDIYKVLEKEYSKFSNNFIYFARQINGKEVGKVISVPSNEIDEVLREDKDLKNI